MLLYGVAMTMLMMLYYYNGIQNHKELTLYQAFLVSFLFLCSCHYLCHHASCFFFFYYLSICFYFIFLSVITIKCYYSPFIITIFFFVAFTNILQTYTLTMSLLFTLIVILYTLVHIIILLLAYWLISIAKLFFLKNNLLSM